MLHRDHIHIQSLFPQGAVLLLYRFCVEHVLIPRSLCILDCPVIFSVIKDCYRRLHLAAADFLQCLQSLSNLCHFFKHAGILSAIVVDHCAVEFFRSPLALMQLEV